MILFRVIVYIILIKDDTSDELYLNLHKIYEKRENDYRMSFYKKDNSLDERNNKNYKIRINYNFLNNDSLNIKN